MESGGAILSAAEPKQIFNKAISRLRKIAAETSDAVLSQRALTVVAGITKKDADVWIALEKADQIGRCSLRVEPLSVLVRILAETGRLSWARKVANEISGVDTYRHAIARIWIARFSAESEDRDAVDEAISKIRASYASVDAVHDRDILLSKKHHHTGIPRGSQFYERLMVLIRSLAELKGFEEDAHCVRPRHTSAYFCHEAESAINWFFAYFMDQ